MVFNYQHPSVLPDLIQFVFRHLEDLHFSFPMSFRDEQHNFNFEYLTGKCFF